MGPDDLRLFPAGLDRNHDIATLLFHAKNFSVDADIDAFLLEKLGDGLRDILVLSADEVWCELNHRDFTFETSPSLCKLQPDITAAEHNQARRQEIHVHHRAVG